MPKCCSTTSPPRLPPFGNECCGTNACCEGACHLLQMRYPPGPRKNCPRNCRLGPSRFPRATPSPNPPQLTLGAWSQTLLKPRRHMVPLPHLDLHLRRPHQSNLPESLDGGQFSPDPLEGEGQLVTRVPPWRNW